MLNAPPVLATVWRGAVCEAQIRGHVAVVAADGSPLASLGDPDAVTTLRSCVKPLQALPFVRQAARELGASGDELAIACGSHGGDARHVATVRRLLDRAGVPETALACGAHRPFDENGAEALIAAGEKPRPVHNNCSGKHAAMLATCAVAGWPAVGYTDPEHPCQRAVSSALAEFIGFDPTASHWAVDGCGLPTFGLPLSALARGFAAANADPDFRSCQDAMTAHPHMVGGAGSFDSALLVAAGDRITAKSGGAAVWVAVQRSSGPAVAIKIEAGAAEALPAVALAVLQRIGALEAQLDQRLAPFARPVLRNWAGNAVGETRVEEATFARL